MSKPYLLRSGAKCEISIPCDVVILKHKSDQVRIEHYALLIVAERRVQQVEIQTHGITMRANQKRFT